MHIGAGQRRQGNDLRDVIRTAEDARRRVSFEMSSRPLSQVSRIGRVSEGRSEGRRLCSKVKPILTSDSGEVRLQPIFRSMRQGINRNPGHSEVQGGNGAGAPGGDAANSAG